MCADEILTESVLSAQKEAEKSYSESHCSVRTDKTLCEPISVLCVVLCCYYIECLKCRACVLVCAVVWPCKLSPVCVVCRTYSAVLFSHSKNKKSAVFISDHFLADYAANDRKFNSLPRGGDVYASGQRGAPAQGRDGGMGR